ncbi:type II secretion system protein GspD [Thiomicrospira microaerophila]|uniref:type II secretion system protein GspD n=1 Tax=Thiomicrospira microaerophila TaxID=406020 RepID=UPI00069917F9|nr:hypothetical protein [Thiomicrospira microaerophila]
MKLFLLFVCSFLLASCATKQVKPVSDVVKEPVIGSSSKVMSDGIPSLAMPTPVNPKPRLETPPSRYTLSAISAPVHEVLYRLGEMAGYEIDIMQGVEGEVTINAVRQSLPSILSRIEAQLNLVITIHNQSIHVRPDRAYWQEYQVDYVNIRRSSQNNIMMNMTVGGSVNPVSGSQGNSSSSVQVSSEHDFWRTLRTSLESIVQPAPQGMAVSESGGDGSVVAQTSERALVVTNPEAGIVMIYANQKKQQKILGYLNSISSRSERQVMIEASVVEVVLSEQHQSGVDWNVTGFGNILATAVGQGTLTTGVSTNLAADFGFGLKALEKFGDVKVLSSPKIMAVNNQPALLKVVDNEVYFTIDVSRSTSTAGTDTTYSTTVHTVPVGFMMSMTPFVSDNNEITLNVRPTISRIIGRVRDPNPDLRAVNVESFIPIIQEREMETVLRLRNNQTAVIGGLIEDRKDLNEQGLPWFSRVPLMGSAIFGNKERSTTKTELVVFIRPIIVDRPDIDNGDLVSFGRYFNAMQGGKK